jgi:hypothetical protein
VTHNEEKVVALAKPEWLTIIGAVCTGVITCWQSRETRRADSTMSEICLLEAMDTRTSAWTALMCVFRDGINIRIVVESPEHRSARRADSPGQPTRS